MKKLFGIILFLPLFSIAQPIAGYYVNTITYDTTNHTCCAEFIDSSISNITLVAWYYYFGDGTAPVTVPDYTHCFTDTGIFEVCLFIDDSIGGSDSCCCMFHFQDLDSAYLVCDSLTGIFENASGRFQLYPNPSSGSFTIDGLPDNACEVSILSVQGNTVYRRTFNRSPALHTVENFSPGIYLVLIRTDDGRLLSNKIIVM